MTKTKPSVKAAALVVRERASAAGEASFTSSTKQPTTETTEAAGQPGRVRPATARAGTTRARSPYASAAVPGFAAAFRKQTEAKGIKPVPATATRTAKTPTPAVREAVASAQAAIAGALTPPGAAASAAEPAREPPTVDITNREDSGEVAALLGAFARRAEALTRGERSADAEPAASAAAAGSGSQSARPTAASAKADASRRAGPASGVPKAASKKPRLPAEMVQKIVTKAVEQRQTERRGASSSSSPLGASKANAPSARARARVPGRVVRGGASRLVRRARAGSDAHRL